jgi:hypothetical protein
VLSFASKRSLLSACSTGGIRGRSMGRAQRRALALGFLALGIAFVKAASITPT